LVPCTAVITYRLRDDVQAKRRSDVTARRRTRVAGFASLFAAAGLCLAALGVAAAAASARGASVQLLPNLVTRPIEDVHIEKSVGTKLLRFSTVVGNRGPGPAELFPDVPDTNDCDGDKDPTNDRIASQRIFNDSNGNGIFERGVDLGFSTAEIGCFIFHPEHHHWHFEEFERYELRRIKSGKLLASSEKVSFCLLDTGTFGSFPGTPGPHYGPCDADVTMGLSVGWSDIYQSNLFGQELDVRGLPGGRYCLAMTADPGERVAEANETDNGRSTVVEIAGPTATDLERRCPGESR
jgi:hypothetical protein